MFFKKRQFKKFTLLFFIQLITLSVLHAESSLSVKLSPNNQNPSSGSILVTLTNSSNEPLRVLKWNTPLEKVLSANIFKLKNGSKNIEYQGRLVKRGQPKEEDYTLFDIGESRTVTISLPQYYKMLKKGDYTIEYRGKFNSLNKNLKSKILQKSNNSTTQLTIPFIPKKIEIRKEEKLTPQFQGCSQSRIDILNEAHDEALGMVKIASTAMNNASKNTTGKRYVTWFGKSTTTRQTDVTTHFSNIYNSLENKKISYDCGTCNDDYSYAYVYPTEHYKIYLCGSFWSANVTGTDSRAGTLIHELSHFEIVAGTDDHVYGQSEARELAKTSPDQAIDNADNYEFFAENTPYIEMENDSHTSRFDNAQKISNFPLSDSINSNGITNIYKLVLSESAEYAFYTYGDLDTYGILYDEQHNILRRRDDISDSNLNFAIYYNFIPNKTYYLEIGAENSDRGKYTLKSYSLSRKKSDFNADTISDIIWRKGSGNYLWYMKADGKHTYKNIGYKSKEYTISGIADFNYDGIADILWRRGAGNSIWYMKSNGKHTYKNIGSKPSDYKVGAVADFNDDGINDILWRRGSGNYFWYMKSDGTHIYKNIGSKSSQYKISAVADFNDDGMNDILWRKGSGNYIWYIRADGTHSYKNIGSKSTQYNINGVADFNGDGIADIFWRKGSTNYLWYMKANGKHTYKKISSKPSEYKISKVADFNGDGIADILWRKGSGNYLWYMKPDGKHTYKNIGSKSTVYMIQN